MIEKIYDKVTVKLEESTYSLDLKLSSYISDTLGLDLYNETVHVLPETKICFGVEIQKYITGTTYKIDIDSRSYLKENLVDIDKLYNIISKFIENINPNHLLLDRDYKIFAYSFGIKEDYIPVNLHDIKSIDLTVNNISPVCDLINKNNNEYLIYAIGDKILRKVESYTLHNIIFLLIKTYIEARFPITDKKSIENGRIISLQGFSFLFYHLRSILRCCKDTYKETIKTGYTTMSKLNFLPKIPSENWITTNYNFLKTDRLKKLLEDKKSESIFQKVGKKLLTIPEPNIYIPTYLSHIFDKNCTTLSWKTFIDTLYLLFNAEMGYYEKLMNDSLAYDLDKCIIFPDRLCGIDKEDILFMGFDGEELYIILKSVIYGKKETPEEVALREKLSKYIKTLVGIESNISFETPEKPQQSFLEY